MHKIPEDVNSYRNSVKNVAKEIGLKGSVKNLEDESVLIICEGERQYIESLIAAINKLEEPVQIDDMQVKYTAATGEFTIFKIILGDMQLEMLNALNTSASRLNTLIDYAKHHSKQNDTLIEQNDDILAQKDRDRLQEQPLV